MAEQLQTSGGGWQDQAGGLYGGFKFIWSPRGLPLEVKVNRLEGVSGKFVEKFNRKLVLIYTGQTRLGKNLVHVSGLWL